nr:WD repeat containing protein 86 [Hymenolepis microstoma]
MPFIDGGSDILADVIAFCYGKEIEINPRNVSFLNSAGRTLDMFGKRNLVDLTEEYINFIISDMRLTHKYGPAIVALAFAAGIKNYEYCETFIRLFDSILSMWARRSQHSDERLAVDPILTEFLVFLPENVVIRIIQEISTMKSTYYAIAELTSKFFALRFALNSIISESDCTQEGKLEDDNGGQEHKDSNVISNFIKKAIATTCVPFERLSSFDKDLLAEEISLISFESSSLDEILDNILSVLPKDVPLASRINVDWCKQALSATDVRRESSISRPLILEITGKMLARFSVQKLRVIPPQTIKDILSTIHKRGLTSTNDGPLLISGISDTDQGKQTASSNGIEAGSIAENLDLYFNAAIESQDMNIEEYISLLKTAMPLARRENHDGVIRGIVKLIRSKKETLTDGLREEILGILDLHRCSAAALQEALEANILPTRAVAEAALKFAKQKENFSNTSSLIVSDRGGTTSPSRYPSSTTSLYRASRYALPFQHYAMPSAYHHFASLSGSSTISASTGYLLSNSSPLRQRRRPWERVTVGSGGLYDRYDDSTTYRHYDVRSNGDYTATKLENDESEWNDNDVTTKTASTTNLRGSEFANMGLTSSCPSNTQGDEIALEPNVDVEAGPDIQSESECSPPSNDLSTNAPMANVKAHTEEINCLVVSEDGSLVASGSEDCLVRVWSTERWDCVRELLGHDDYITCLVFVGTRLLSGSGDMKVLMWDLIQGDCIFTITGHTGCITSICVTQTQIFTSANDHQVHCWSLEDGTPIREYTGHKGTVYGIRISTGANESINQENSMDASAGRRRVRFVTFSADCTARLWSTTRSTSLQTFRGHSGPVTCVAVDEERHYLYTGSSDGRVGSWLMETGERIHWFEGHSAPIINLLVSDDCLFSASSDETVRAWVTDIAQELQVFKGHGHTVFKLCLLKGDTLITGSGDGKIRCFDTKTSTMLEQFVCPEVGKFCCFELNGRSLIAASQEGRICAWDLSAMMTRTKAKENASF